MKKTDKDWEGTELEIKEEPNTCWLSLKHAKWPENKGHFRHSAYCSSMLLYDLKEYLEKGVIVPFENRS